MMLTRAITADKLTGLPVASSCAGSESYTASMPAKALFSRSNVEASKHLISHQPWISSVPTSKPEVSLEDQHPGTEDRVDTCDAAHTNFIIPGRNVA